MLIFANWRGFSGGMKDMYEQIVKFGAYIVDGLRKYQQPIFVYIPPYGELRGGAWAVVDSTINERFMEMYADSLAKGGILEPEGTVEIKFRKKDLINTMLRIDKPLMELNSRVNEFNRAQPPTERKSSISHKTVEQPKLPEVVELEREMDARIKLLLPMYHQVAVTFADLHDTPERMLEKNTIHVS